MLIEGHNRCNRLYDVQGWPKSSGLGRHQSGIVNRFAAPICWEGPSAFVEYELSKGRNPSQQIYGSDDNHSNAVPVRSEGGTSGRTDAVRQADGRQRFSTHWRVGEWGGSCARMSSSRADRRSRSVPIRLANSSSHPPAGRRTPDPSVAARAAQSERIWGNGFPRFSDRMTLLIQRTGDNPMNVSLHALKSQIARSLSGIAVGFAKASPKISGEGFDQAAPTCVPKTSTRPVPS
jgi:hypothetical protein